VKSVREVHSILQKEPLDPGLSRHLADHSGLASLNLGSSGHLADHSSPAPLDPGSSQD
jgi:hypothetical protein